MNKRNNTYDHTSMRHERTFNSRDKDVMLFNIENNFWLIWLLTTPW
ncbi:MAG: hypothetical protein FWG67_04695 [Defluviitaleaceae bacterium]|nr:hypothetical protein [Defluviitaleaceae bacterium]